MALKRMDNVGIVVDDLGATIDFSLQSRDQIRRAFQ